MRGGVAIGLITAVLSTAIAAAAHAQVERSGGGASQKIMQQYQQLAAEKTALQGQVEQLKKDLDASKAELSNAKKERDALKLRAGGSAAALAQIAQFKSAKESSDRALEQNKQRMTDLIAQFRSTATNLKEIEAERSKLRGDVAQRNQAFDACAQNNLGLYEISRDVLDRYEHTGLFTRVSASEPFTKITRTRIENLVDEYRARAEELRVQKRAQSSPQQAGTAGVAK